MSEEEKKETFREAKILEVLNHPNIIRFKEVYKTKKGQLCIVMDFADGMMFEFSNFRWWSCLGDQETAGKGRILFWRLDHELVYIDLLKSETYSRQEDSSSWLEESKYIHDEIRNNEAGWFWYSESSIVNSWSRVDNSRDAILSQSRNYWKRTL